MAKTCQNCGKTQAVEINRKRYCANCGEIVQSAPLAPKSLPSRKPAQKPTYAKARKLPNVLDLSATEGPVKYHPAQSIHGQRRPQPTIASSPTPSPVIKARHAQRHAARSSRAASTKRHPRVERFNLEPVAASARSDPGPTEAIAAHPMAPHRIYQINSLEETAVPKETRPPKHSQNKRSRAAKKWLKKTRDKWKFLTRRRQAAPILAVVAVVLALGGYITYLNVPSIAVRIAASRAGVDVQLPNYRPPGYALNKLVSYSPGQVTVRFNSDSDRGYVDLTQRQTDWDPQTLLENYVTPKSANYIPFNQNGLTIYVYSGNNAAWINNGFFYTLEGNNQLNQDQVLKMAASL